MLRTLTEEHRKTHTDTVSRVKWPKGENLINLIIHLVHHFTIYNLF